MSDALWHLAWILATDLILVVALLSFVAALISWLDGDGFDPMWLWRW